jgi:biopolymer transport protein ExbD
VSKGRRTGIKMDMTPFVDIAFLLLIFFMTTTSFKPPEPVQVKLPSSHVEIKVPESNVLVLSIGSDGTLVFQVGLNSTEAAIVPMSDLRNLILTKRANNRALRMAIRADKDVSYGVMADVMKILQDTNTTRFNLVTEFEDDRGSEIELQTAPSPVH